MYLGETAHRKRWFPVHSPGEGTKPHRSLSTPSVLSSALELPRSIAVGDLDDDESPDIVIADLHGDKITWFRNVDGAGGFSAGVAIDTGANSARDVHLSDIDGDGDLDVIATMHDDGTYF